MMSRAELLAISFATGIHERYSLPLEPGGPACAVRLRCLPGASRLHLALAVEGEIRLRAEIEVGGGEVVDIEIELDTTGEIYIESANWHVLFLPPDERFGPVPAFRSPPLEQGLDLAVVFDGTLRTFEVAGERAASAPTSMPLLAVAHARDQLIEQLVSFIDALGVQDLRAAVLAFGDEPLADATAPDLNPSYHLHPLFEELALRSATTDDVFDSLTRLPPTLGADFVDALADALAACETLRWRPAARKLIFVVGDSPGHSLLEPAPWGCDARARDNDVDVEVLKLHRRGIEIATLYCPPPRQGVYDYFEPSLRTIFDHARKQYQGLASLAKLAFELPTFDPQAAAMRFHEPSGWIARGSAYGELLEVRTTETGLNLQALRPTSQTRITRPENKLRRRPARVKAVEQPESAIAIESPTKSAPQVPLNEAASMAVYKEAMPRSKPRKVTVKTTTEDTQTRDESKILWGD